MKETAEPVAITALRINYSSKNLRNIHRRWHKFLSDNKVEHVYLEDSGMHDWAFWSKSIEPAFRWLTAED
ncbi:MAG: hypothetical protein IJG48_08565 [Mogibacterium sp.]|nr:hypothetical protein [Mogibacterium sp.]